MTEQPAFQRVLLKLSGEALMGDLDFGTDAGTVEAIARQLKRVHDRGVEISVVGRRPGFPRSGVKRRRRTG